MNEMSKATALSEDFIEIWQTYEVQGRFHHTVFEIIFCYCLATVQRV